MNFYTFYKSYEGIIYQRHESFLYKNPGPWYDSIIYTFRIYCSKCGEYFESKVELTCSPKQTKEEVHKNTKDLALRIIKAKYNIKEK